MNKITSWNGKMSLFDTLSGKSPNRGKRRDELKIYYFRDCHPFGEKSMTIEEWLKQQKAEYTGDCIDGGLLDNFVVFTKSGTAAIYEEFVNSCESQYRIEFQTGSADDLWERWYAFEKEVWKEEEMNQEY